MYAKLDELITFRIKEGFKTFVMINSANARDEAKRIAQEQNTGRDKRDHVDAWRLVDRRLQALRKKGVITYDRKAGWTLKDAR